MSETSSLKAYTDGSRKRDQNITERVWIATHKLLEFVFKNTKIIQNARL